MKLHLVWKIIIFILSVCFVSQKQFLLADSAPEPPTQFHAHVDSHNVITFTWKASVSSSVAGYLIYFDWIRETNWKGQSKNFVFTEKPIQGTQYIFRGMDMGAYTFVLRAVSNSVPPVESRDSNVAIIDIEQDQEIYSKTPMVPEGQGCFDVAKQQGMEKWPAPASVDQRGYNVYVLDQNRIFTLANREPIGNVPSYLVRNLKVGKLYFFNFTAVNNKDIESVHSNSVVGIARPCDSVNNK